MDQLTFKCYNCKKESPFEISVNERDKVMRLMPDQNEKFPFQFICKNCGTANQIKLNRETISKILKNPDIMNLINKTLGGFFRF